MRKQGPGRHAGAFVSGKGIYSLRTESAENLTEADRVVLSIRDGLIQIQVTVPDLQVEPAFRVRAYPCLKLYGRALTPEVGQRNKIAGTTLLALRKLHHHQTTSAAHYMFPAS